jgi:hypothetical protein
VRSRAGFALPVWELEGRFRHCFWPELNVLGLHPAGVQVTRGKYARVSRHIIRIGDWKYCPTHPAGGPQEGKMSKPDSPQ